MVTEAEKAEGGDHPSPDEKATREGKKREVKSKITDKLRSGGPPGHITPEILRELLIEIIDLI
jgi:hypothetical protein